MTILEQAAQAKAASYAMMNLSSSLKDDALQKMADALEHNADYILEQNEKDLAKARQAGLSDALLDRLRLTKLRISLMAEGLRKIAALPDPLGAEDYVIKRPNGLAIGKRRVPLGVIGIIYEARPNVTSDAIGLCIKSSNAMLLRGGSEAINSNIAVAD
ncbi:MAG TPA: gamma-glutamyl-phosphate reductase, partial [Clostridia bacterium]|nr:gamma-glutamyl-phosphate reductase [Clostridia bacterium]